LFGDEAEVVRELNFQLVLLAALLVPLGNGLMSPILDSLIGPFGASPASIGLMISFFLVPSIVIMPVVGVVADRVGRKPIIVGSLVLFGLAGAAIALTTDYRVVLGLRFLQGIGWGSLTTLIITAIGDFYSGATEAAAQGLRLSGSSLAASGFSLLAGALVVLAWQWPFLIYLLALPIAAVVLRYLDEPTNDNDGDGPASIVDYRETFGGLLRQPRVLLIVVGRMLQISVWIGFTAYNSIIVVRILDGTPVEAGMLYAVGTLSMAVGASQVGRAAAFFKNRYRVLIVANGALGLGFATAALAPALPLAAVGVAALGAAHGMAVSTYRSLITGFAPESVRAGLVSLGEAGARVAAMSAPILMGAIIAAYAGSVGFVAAVQFGALTVSLLAGGGGILLVAAASRMPAV
jgi:MFS family permease